VKFSVNSLATDRVLRSSSWILPLDLATIFDLTKYLPPTTTFITLSYL